MEKRVNGKLKYIVSLFILVITGCGTSSESTNTLELGKWTLPCTNDSSGYSEQGTLLISENFLDFDTKHYYDIDCNEDDLNIHFTRRDEYSIGKAIKFSNGMDGRELNFLISKYNVVELNPYTSSFSEDYIGIKGYSMYTIKNKKLYFAYPNRDKGLDGSTTSKRANFFNGKYYIINN